MPPFRKMALPLLGTLAFAGALFARGDARAQSPPPPVIGEEMQHARNDFATGGIRRLSTNWYACVDQARGNQDANTAERCGVYGFSALLLGDTDPSAARTPWIRHLTADLVVPGQLEMLSVMGIPEGPRQAWLDRYRRWVSNRYTPTTGVPNAGVADRGGLGSDTPDPEDSRGDAQRGRSPHGGGQYGAAPHRYAPIGRGQIDGAPFDGVQYDGAPYRGAPRRDSPYGHDPNAGAPFDGVQYDGAPYRGTPGRDAPYGREPYAGAPYGAASVAGGRGNRDGLTGLAQTANGKYPREVLRDPGIADALRHLLPPALLAHLENYSFGGPMEFTGHYTTGMACEPRACGVSEARYVFSPDEVWIGVIDGRRMRIYGNPPSQARALLLRDRNRTVWRGAVEDMTHPVPPQVVQASVDVTSGGPPPRMSIAPRPFPVAADPMTRAPPDGGTTEVKLRNHGGTLEVPVTINGAVTLPFSIDSGASDVSVSAGVMQKLIEAGTVSRSDFLGKQVYHLADGSAVASETFRIHVLKVGDREVRDVMGSITGDADSLLLGQSFLQRFRSWSIDNQRQVLLLK